MDTKPNPVILIGNTGVDGSPPNQVTPVRTDAFGNIGVTSANAFTDESGSPVQALNIETDLDGERAGQVGVLTGSMEYSLGPSGNWDRNKSAPANADALAAQVLGNILSIAQLFAF